MDLYPDERRIRSSTDRSSWIGPKGIFALSAAALVGLFIYLLDDLNLFLSGDEKEKVAVQQSPALKDQPHLTPAEAEADAQKPVEFTQPPIHTVDKTQPAKEITAEIGGDNSPVTNTVKNTTTIQEIENAKSQQIGALQKTPAEQAGVFDKSTQITQSMKQIQTKQLNINSLAKKEIIPLEKNKTDVSDADDEENASDDADQDSLNVTPKKVETPTIEAQKTDKHAFKQARKTTPVEKPKVIAAAPTKRTGYALQLLGGGDISKVQRFVSDRKLDGKAVIAKTKRNNQDWYIVLYGEYQNREAALSDMKSLPSSIRDIQPWPRKFADAGMILR